MNSRYRSLIWIGGSVACVRFGFWAADAAGISRNWPLTAVVLAVGYFLYSKIPGSTWIMLSRQAYEQAVLNGDETRATQLARELVTEHRRWAPSWLADLSEAGYLAEQERYREAANIMARLDASALSENSKTIFLNNLAWCKAHLGHPEEAIENAREAVSRAEAARSPILGSCRGTLGTALLLAGRESESLPLLIQAAEAHSAQPDSLVCNAYYLGEAYRRLNRLAESRFWLERAIRAAPNTRFGKRALAALAGLRS